MKGKERHGAHAHLGSSAIVRAKRTTGLFLTLLVNSTHCTTPHMHLVGDLLLHRARGKSGLYQEIPSLVTAAVSFLPFCRSWDLPAGLLRHRLQSTMTAFVVDALLPSSLTMNHWKLPAYVSVCPASQEQKDLILVRALAGFGFFCNEFSCGHRVVHLSKTFHNPRCPLALMDRGWQLLVTRRQGWEARVHLERRWHICCSESEGLKRHVSTLW